jgi:hypothetical protein
MSNECSVKSTPSCRSAARLEGSAWTGRAAIWARDAEAAYEVVNRAAYLFFGGASFRFGFGSNRKRTEMRREDDNSPALCPSRHHRVVPKLIYLRAGWDSRDFVARETSARLLAVGAVSDRPTGRRRPIGHRPSRACDRERAGRRRRFRRWRCREPRPSPPRSPWQRPHDHGASDPNDQCCTLHHHLTGVLPEAAPARAADLVVAAVVSPLPAPLVPAEPGLLERPPKLLSV